MNKEELAYNDYYERTKDYGRSQFVKLIVATEEEKRLLNNRITKLQQENNQLKEQRQELRSWLKEWLKITEKQYDELKEPVRKSFLKVTIDTLKEFLSKLNELEGGKND